MHRHELRWERVLATASFAWMTLRAARWFDSRDELQKTFPGAMTVRSWEMVPRQVLRLSEDDLGSPRIAGVLIFANYLTPGEHRIRLPYSPEGFLVQLGERGFSAGVRPL